MKRLLPYIEHKATQKVSIDTLMVGQQIKYKKKGYDDNLPRDQQSKFVGQGTILNIDKNQDLISMSSNDSTIKVSTCEILNT